LWSKWFQHPQDISARIFSEYRGRNFGGIKSCKEQRREYRKERGGMEKRERERRKRKKE
jgi:hypothetical protein